MSNKLLGLACNCVFIVILFFVLNEGVGLTKWINSIFYITAMNMILFLYLLILKGKFFDSIIHSFQRFMKKSRADEIILPSETVSISTYKVFKFNFFTLASVLVTMQVFYFIII